MVRKYIISIFYLYKMYLGYFKSNVFVSIEIIRAFLITSVVWILVVCVFLFFIFGLCFFVFFREFEYFLVIFCVYVFIFNNLIKIFYLVFF